MKGFFGVLKHFAIYTPQQGWGLFSCCGHEGLQGIWPCGNAACPMGQAALAVYPFRLIGKIFLRHIGFGGRCLLGFLRNGFFGSFSSIGGLFCLDAAAIF